MRHMTRFLCAAVVGLMVFGAVPSLAETVKWNWATFIGARSQSNVYYQKMIKEIAAETNGEFQIDLHMSASMGPPPRHYDLVRTGVADISYYMHGMTPGRFPLTELAHFPYLIPKSEVGSMVLWDMKGQLAKEHRGTKLLWMTTTMPSLMFTREKPITKISDINGLRVRAPSRFVANMVRALGGTPVGIPVNDMAESLQKGVIDGVLTENGGITIFRAGSLVKYRTPMIKTSFTFGMSVNPGAYAKLPPKFRKILDAKLGTREMAIKAGAMINNPRYPGYVKKSGVMDVALTPDADARIRALGDAEAAKIIAALEKKGLPAKTTYERMKELSAKYGAM